MNGKNRCRILKEIRKKIADENGIEYVTTECKYKGDCLGTCPKCESEVRYLERELDKKRSLGQRIAIAGIAAGITVSAVGCTPDTMSNQSSGIGGEEIAGDMAYAESSNVSENICSRPEESKVSEIVDGEMVEVIGEMPDYSDCSDDSEAELMGEPSEDIWETMGEETIPPISNPYTDVMGMIAAVYDIHEVAKMESSVAFETFKHWQREYIDYDWRNFIVRREFGATVFQVNDGEVKTKIWFYFDSDGNVTNVHIYNVEEEITGEEVLPEDYE